MRTCREAGIPRGAATRAVCCLSCVKRRGFTLDRFCYEGFFTCQIKGRRDALKAIEAEPRTLIFMNQPTVC